MIDTSCEVQLCRLEWVVSWEVDVQEEHTADVWRVIRAHNGSLPMVLIFLINWSG